MLAKTESVALVGTEARLIQVEVYVADSGLPGYSIVGLPTKSVREAEQRTRAAIAASGEVWNRRQITANLAPGALRKDGTHFDLPLALGMLAGAERIDASAIDGWVCIGELGLDGSVRPVRGAFAAALASKDAGRRGVICPAANAPEAALVSDVTVVAVQTLRECIDFFRGEWSPRPISPSSSGPQPEIEDMTDVRGHAAAKRAAEIAAAGGHNLLLAGPPGSGKTMLARRLPGILPEMSFEEAVEVTKIYSVAGLLRHNASLIRSRPFRNPHHSISLAGLVGGGVGLAHPGEASLAHHGVLFMDELTLYRRDVLESLRGPLEEGSVRIARSGGAISFPCRFSLVAAMNPCPCGYLGDHRRACRCSEHQLDLYRARLSGPLVDRIDIQIQMGRLTRQELMGGPSGETSTEIRARVESARAAQSERYRSCLTTNATVRKAGLERAASMTKAARSTLELAVDNLALSGRGLDRTKRVARTIADLYGASVIEEEHIAEALSYRLLDIEQTEAA